METVVASPQRAKSPIPKISSARGSQIPAGIWSNSRRDLLDAIARASPMDEVGSIPTSSIKIERAVHCRFCCQVGLREPARRLRQSTCFPRRLSGGQSATAKCPTYCRQFPTHISSSYTDQITANTTTFDKRPSHKNVPLPDIR